MSHHIAHDACRRRVLAWIACSGAGLALSGRALAAPPLPLPCRVAYVRFCPDGYERMLADERLNWNRMAVRLGELVTDIRPLAESQILPGDAPWADNGASAALAARRAAALAGFNAVLIYAMDFPERPAGKDNTDGDQPADAEAASPGRARGGRSGHNLFRALKDVPLPATGLATGEAHLVSVSDGGVLASVFAEVEQHNALGLVRRRIDPRAALLEQMSEGMEREFNRLASAAYRANASRTSRF